MGHHLTVVNRLDAMLMKSQQTIYRGDTELNLTIDIMIHAKTTCQATVLFLIIRKIQKIQWQLLLSLPPQHCRQRQKMFFEGILTTIRNLRTLRKMWM